MRAAEVACRPNRSARLCTRALTGRHPTLFPFSRRWRMCSVAEIHRFFARLVVSIVGNVGLLPTLLTRPRGKPWDPLGRSKSYGASQQRTSVCLSRAG